MNDQDEYPDPRSLTLLGRITARLERFRVEPRQHSAHRASLRIMLVVLTTSLVAGSWTLHQYLKTLGIFEISKHSVRSIIEWVPADNSRIYDRQGNILGELFSSYHIYTPFEELPNHLVTAVIAVEDKNFFYHPGIDIKAIVRATIIYIKGRKSGYTQGASTITQQVVRHFLLSKEKTIDRKVREVALALELEKHLSKKQILSIYVNAMYLGNRAYGVGAAARRYFNKSVGQLEPHESALLAGLFQSPSRYNPQRHPQRAKSRQLKVLSAMTKLDYLDRDQARYWYNQPLDYKDYQPHYSTQAPFFVDHVRTQAKKLLGKMPIKNRGLRIYTTLDPTMQKLAREALHSAQPTFEEVEARMAANNRRSKTKTTKRLEGAVLVGEPASGAILAMVGGRDHQRSKFNRTTQALRQPGSAFKPVVYSLALSRGTKWSDMTYVAPVTIGGHYRPRSPQKEYMTETTLLRAFYRSMNAPTMEIGEKLGIKRIIDHARRLGLTTPVRKEFGSILGSSETTMWDVLQLYSVFANAGKRTDLYCIDKITDHNDRLLYQAPELAKRTQQALSPQINFLMLQGLRNVLLRGTGYAARNLGQVAAGKTGTSNRSKDNWFAGFTKDISAVVWVGADEFAALGQHDQGATLALPIWQHLMEAAVPHTNPRPFARPPGLVNMKIHREYGYPDPSGIEMWFVDSNVPSEEQRQVGDLSRAAEFRNPFSR